MLDRSQTEVTSPVENMSVDEVITLIFWTASLIGLTKLTIGYMQEPLVGIYKKVKHIPLLLSLGSRT